MAVGGHGWVALLVCCVGGPSSGFKFLSTKLLLILKPLRKLGFPLVQTSGSEVLLFLGTGFHTGFSFLRR